MILDSARSLFLVRKNIEHFNALKTDSDRKEFVRRIQPNEIRDLYLYFNDDPKKQREICRLITTEDLDSLAKAKDANHAKYCEKIRDFYSGRMHWPYNDRINGLSQNYSLETLAHAFISWDDPKQKEEIHAVITSKKSKS